ncbi:hypothetical protein OOZ54_12680 [Rhodopseudomonas palustris]|uniref:hypothetical protein n=1 Tax=Rhodopseudomonas palustris TaxID=1076 RepID=UPI0022F03E67|nr:hypothetical protein [Rhodopseudomonas palustris]WBU27550.1 hypothetical protein OOZ54_12680 [Rhodopseudomonas palustris]
MPKSPKPFPSESDLCARFISVLPPGWTPYNEWGGWDILLVRDSDGFQIGIEAKLRLNAEVISQALEEYGSWAADLPGPDCRAVLVPSSEPRGFHRICKYIGVTVIYCSSEAEIADYYRKYRPNRMKPLSPLFPGDRYGNSDDWYEWAPPSRIKLPDYVPDVEAGRSAPVQLTDWKIRAIKIAIILEKRGHLRRSDFKHINIDHRRWLPSGNGWLLLGEDRTYRPAPGFPDFRAQHPRVYAEIEADYEKWKPTEPAEAVPSAVQESML